MKSLFLILISFLGLASCTTTQKLKHECAQISFHESSPSQWSCTKTDGLKRNLTTQEASAIGASKVGFNARGAGLSDYEIQWVFDRHNSNFLDCYRAMNQAFGHGETYVEFDIGLSGQILGEPKIKNSYNNSNFDICVNKAVHKMQFPSPRKTNAMRISLHYKMIR